MRNLSGKVLIFYTFQSATKPIEFNVTTFKKSAPQQPKIRDVLYQLPLDFEKNSYHFRFKSQFFENDEKINGWIDISNLLAKVPIVNNNIFVKILKLPDDTNNKLFNKQKLTAIGLINPKGATTSSTNSNTPVNNNQAQSQKQVPAPNPTQQVKKNNSNLFDLQSPVKQNISSSPVKQPKKQQSVPKTQQPSQSPDKPYVPGSQTPEERLKGFQQTCKRQQQQRELERKAISFHQIKLQQWGFSGHKTINNLTTLLATLHTIWPEWQPVSLADMLKPEDVTALYKKAAIRLHPDKNIDKDYNTKYLSKRIFQLLNQAKKAQK